MGPEIIAFIFIVCALLGWRGAVYIDHKRGIDAPEQPKELETPLACEALVTRVFEQRLVDAGIMEVIDMTTCDSEQCSDCSPTRLAIHVKEKCAVAECLSKGTEFWNENEMLCKTHWDARKQTEATKRTLKSISGRKDKKREIILPGGNRIPWPEQVPEFAHYEVRRQDLGRGASINYDIMFTWIGKFGQTEYIRLVVPDFTPMSGDIRTGSGVVIATTKEHRESLRRRGYKGTYPPLTPERRRAAIESIRKQGRKQKKKEAVEAALRRGNMKFYDSAINRRNKFKCWCEACDGKKLHPLPKPPKGPGAGSPFIPKHTLNRTP